MMTDLYKALKRQNSAVLGRRLQYPADDAPDPIGERYDARTPGLRRSATEQERAADRAAKETQPAPVTSA